MTHPIVQVNNVWEMLQPVVGRSLERHTARVSRVGHPWSTDKKCGVIEHLGKDEVDVPESHLRIMFLRKRKSPYVQ
ncbi:hypothetical protein TNCV_4157441 [Trichonephila clavipes]|nr:hypothetical protein TNCV_4157441 [Trichonephila clavipes]